MAKTTHPLNVQKIRGDLCFSLSYDLKGSFSED